MPLNSDSDQYDSFDDSDSMTLELPAANVHRSGTFASDDEHDVSSNHLHGTGREPVYSSVESDTPLGRHRYRSNSQDSLDQKYTKDARLPNNAAQWKDSKTNSGSRNKYKSDDTTMVSEIRIEVDTTMYNALNDSPVTPGFGADAISNMSFAHFKGFKPDKLRSGSVSSEDITMTDRERQDSQASTRGAMPMLEEEYTDDENGKAWKSETDESKKSQKDGYVAEMARRLMNKDSDSSLSVTMERHQRSVSEGRNGLRDKNSFSPSKNHLKTGSEDRSRSPNGQSRSNCSDQSDDSTSTVAQLAARFGKRQTPNRPAPVKTGQSPSDVVTTLASPTRAAAMADVHSSLSIFKGRRKSKEFAAMQRSVMANATASVAATLETNEPEVVKSPKKSKLPFFGHKKAGSSDVTSSNDHAKSTKTSRRLSDSNTSLVALPNLPPGNDLSDIPSYISDEPRASSISIADEIAKLLPDAGWTALTTGGGTWATHPNAVAPSLNEPSLMSQSSQIWNIETKLQSEETDDLLVQLLVSQAIIDAKDFEVLGLEEVDEVKNTHRLLQSRVQSQGARLALETKIREAARNLSRLHAGNRELARQANDQLQASNRKVDQVATELWKLTQRAADVQRSWLQHTAGALVRGIKSLEMQLDTVRSQVHTTATTVADTQVSDRVSRATVELRMEADSYKKDLESRQREVQSLRGELEAVYLKLETISMVGHAGEEAARNAEDRLTSIESELESARNRLYNMQTELNKAREQLARHEAEPPTDLRAAVQATLREAMLSKEKSRTEAEGERRRREDAERHIEGLTQELEELRAASSTKTSKDDTEAIQERDKRITILQRQIKEATEDIDLLRAESQETNEIPLFSGLPELTPMSSGPDMPPPSPRLSAQTRYSLDAFVLRIQNLIAHYRRLTDKVLVLQSRTEELNETIEQNKETTAEAEERVDKALLQVKRAEERAEKEKERADLAIASAEDKASNQIKVLEQELGLLREREVDVQTAVARLTKDLEAAEEATSFSDETISVRVAQAEAQAEERIIKIRYEAKEQIQAAETRVADVIKQLEQAESRATNAANKLEEEKTRAERAEAALAKATAAASAAALAAKEDDRFKTCCLQLQERLAAIAYKEMDLDATANSLRSQLRHIQHTAVDLHHIVTSKLGNTNEIENNDKLSPIRGRLDSVGILEYRSELEMANREIERLQRMAAEWQDERLMLEMNVEAYRTRVVDLEKHSE